MHDYIIGNYVEFITNMGQSARGKVIEVFHARELDLNSDSTEDVLLIATDGQYTRKPKPTRAFRFATDVSLCRKAPHASGTSVPSQGNRRNASS
jgi:hypothetical protein